MSVPCPIQQMDASRLVALIVVVMSPLVSADNFSTPSLPVECLNLDVEEINVLQGEQFYFVPYDMGRNLSNDDVKWYKTNSSTEPISSDQNQRVHYRGGALLFMDLRPEDSGDYTAYEFTSPELCYKHHVKIEVFKAENDTALLYGDIQNSDVLKWIPCPGPVGRICSDMKGSITFRKDFKPLRGQEKRRYVDQIGDSYGLKIESPAKDDEGVYTCVCTWKYNEQECISSASRRLELLEHGAHFEPQILSPATTTVLADEGVRIQLNCSVLCGQNVQPYCNAHWTIDGQLVSQGDGYNQTQQTVNEPVSKNTIATAVLAVERVSTHHFRSEFTCHGKSFYQTATKSITLKQRESIIPLVVGGVWACLFLVAALVLVKRFAVDLALLFRPCVSKINHKRDARAYDAYVVYQTQHLDKNTEEALCQFITKTLPSVLEDKCGYRLFIQGRDDTPGEDHLELVEGRMQQSKRLMVVLTPASVSEPAVTDRSPVARQTAALSEFDWQVGLHHALVQREMSIILIQIGDTAPDGYKHLPPGLQHLIEKSAPVRWREGSRGATSLNSRFWKNVRYLMPAVPATKYHQSAFV